MIELFIEPSDSIHRVDYLWGVPRPPAERAAGGVRHASGLVVNAALSLPVTSVHGVAEMRSGSWPALDSIRYRQPAGERPVRAGPGMRASWK